MGSQAVGIRKRLSFVWTVALVATLLAGTGLPGSLASGRSADEGGAPLPTVPPITAPGDTSTTTTAPAADSTTTTAPPAVEPPVTTVPPEDPPPADSTTTTTIAVAPVEPAPVPGDPPTRGEPIATPQHDDPGIDVEKYASVAGPGGPWNNATRPETTVGADVWLRIAVENTGNSRLTNFALTDVTISGDGVDYQSALDAAMGDPACPAPPESSAGTWLSPGSTWECVYGPFPALAGLHENRAFASADSLDEDGDINFSGIEDSDPAGYVGAGAAPPPAPASTPAAAIGIEKQVSVDGAAGPWDDADAPTGPEVVPGEDVHFRFAVTNTGDVTLEALSLADTDFQAAIASQCTIPATLAIGAGFECVIGPFPANAGQHQNKATVTARALGSGQQFPRDFPLFPELTGKGSQYVFVFEDGTVVRGSSQPGGNGFTGRQYEPDLNPALAALGVPWRLRHTVHVSCSDVFRDGWALEGSPAQGVDPFRLTAFSIVRFKKGAMEKTCGSGVVLPTVTVMDMDEAHYLGIAARPASIGDRVWRDVDGNGRQDGGEPGVPGVTVELLDGARNPTGRTTTTGGAGEYLFDNLVAGVDYFVRFVRPDGFLYTVPNRGDDAGDSDASIFTGTSDRVTPVPGEFDDTVDAGLFACPVTGAYVVDLAGTRLLDSGPLSTGTRPMTIPAGTYSVTLVGADFFEGHAGQNQKFEQYFVVLYDGAGNVVYESPAMSDLPETQHVLVETVDERAVFSTGVETFEGLHVAVRIGDQPTSNSIDPVCAVFDPAGQPAGITIVKSTNGDDANDPPGPQVPVGEPVAWRYEVTVQGDFSLDDVVVTDDQGVVPGFVSGDDGDGLLEPGEVWVYEAGAPAVAGQYRNVGTAGGQPVDSGGAPVGARVSDDDPSHYFGVAAPAAAIDVEKYTSSAAVPGRGEDADVAPGPSIPIGDQVRWTYEVSNPGDLPLSDIIVFDDQGEVPVYVRGDDNGSGTLDPGEVYVFEATNSAVGGQYRNVTRAVATPRLPDGTPLPVVEDTDPSHYFGDGAPAAAIDVEKFTSPAVAPGRGDDADAAPGPYLPAGDLVRWTYLVSNPGDVPLSDIIVFDDQGEVPVYVQGDDNGSGMLDPGEVYVFEATNGALAGQYRNVTRAVATPRLMDGTALPAVEDTDPSHYFGAVGGISVEKSTNGVDADTPPGPEIVEGTTVTWTYRVSNAGNVALASVGVTDDQGVTPVLVSGDDGDGLLEIGEVWVFHASATAVRGPYANVGTAIGQPVDPGGAALGAPVTASDPSHYLGIPGPPG